MSRRVCRVAWAWTSAAGSELIGTRVRTECRSRWAVATVRRRWTSAESMLVGCVSICRLDEAVRFFDESKWIDSHSRLNTTRTEHAFFWGFFCLKEFMTRHTAFFWFMDVRALFKKGYNASTGYLFYPDTCMIIDHRPTHRQDAGRTVRQSSALSRPSPSPQRSVRLPADEAVLNFAQHVKIIEQRPGLPHRPAREDHRPESLGL